MFYNNKQSTAYKSLLFPEKSLKKDNKKNTAAYYEKDLDDAGDNTKTIVSKAVLQGNKEAEKKKISESEKPVYLDNYIKAQVAADNNLQLYNNAVINMAKSELKSGISNPSSKKVTESLATMESKYIPMTEYVKSKDESDYKKRLFTTTKYADPVYSDELKEYQKKLNQAGITDKFGDSIDEDGLWGAQTISATKKLLEAAKNSEELKNLAKSVAKGVDTTVSTVGDIGKGSLMVNYFSPAYIQYHKNFAAETFKGAKKRYGIKLGEASNNGKNNYLQMFDNNSKARVTRFFGLDSSIENGKKIYHYNIIRDAYTPDELDTIGKTLGYKDGADLIAHNLKNNDANIHVPASKSVVNASKVLKATSKILEVGGKAMAWAGTAYDIAKITKTIYDDIDNDNGKVDKKTVSIIADAGGSWAGSALGASLGAKVGMAIGTALFPIAGTALGGLIGSAVGGAIGAFCGGKGASVLSEKIYDEVVD